VIGSLRGQLLDRDPTFVEALIEVGGIGYRVQFTATGLVSLPDVGTEVFVHVHHHIREADQQLFGFLAIDERKAFEALLSAHGVGPALALAILGVHPPADLRLAVASDDVDALCLVPGVGKKTAARLLIELKNKLDLPTDIEATVAAISEGSAVTSVKADVREALVGLGYAGDEIRGVLADLPEEGDVGELVRQALQKLSSW
jgi:Holliday junction DNA helicase RuvA